jgi:hypothetical protein
LLGLNPRLWSIRRFGTQAVLLVFFCVRHRITSVMRHRQTTFPADSSRISVEVPPRSPVATAEAAAAHERQGKVVIGCMYRVTFFRNSSVTEKASWRKVAWTVTALHSHWPVYVILYFVGLSHVDIFHALFLLIFVLIVPSPTVRKALWKPLVSGGCWFCVACGCDASVPCCRRCFSFLLHWCFSTCGDSFLTTAPTALKCFARALGWWCTNLLMTATGGLARSESWRRLCAFASRRVWWFE